MVFLKPVQRVFEKVAPHLVAVGAIVVDRLSPRRAVTIGEIRTIGGQVIPLGTEVVVDNIQRDRESARMNCIDQPLQASWSAIRVLRRKRVNSVIAPISRTGKLCNRHEFYRGDAELDESIEMWNQSLKRSFLRIGPGVDFIEDAALERHANPMFVSPHQGTRIHQLRRPVHALRLKSGNGVRQLSRIVDAIEILCARLNRLDHREVIAAIATFHFDEPFLRPKNVNTHTPRRSP